jgi:peptidoglycan hydrolase-like protein with peptidoglycan-binding domain
MIVLGEGMSGSDVAELQTRLQGCGFSPDAIDGSFGQGWLRLLEQISL